MWTKSIVEALGQLSSSCGLHGFPSCLVPAASIGGKSTCGLGHRHLEPIDTQVSNNPSWCSGGSSPYEKLRLGTTGALAHPKSLSSFWMLAPNAIARLPRWAASGLRPLLELIGNDVCGNNSFLFVRTGSPTPCWRYPLTFQLLNSLQAPCLKFLHQVLLIGGLPGTAPDFADLHPGTPRQAQPLGLVRCATVCRPRGWAGTHRPVHMQSRHLSQLNKNACSKIDVCACATSSWTTYTANPLMSFTDLLLWLNSTHVKA